MPLASAASRYPGGAGAAIGSGGSYSGTFIPEIWSSKMLMKFYDATVLGGITNTEYEGEFANMGDTIKIRQRPDVTIRNYSPDQEIVVERPNAPIVEMTIDYAKYFAPIVDDVYKVQADMDLLGMWTQEAAEAVKVQIDKELLLAIFLGGAHSTNRGATAGRVTGGIPLGVTTAPRLIVPRAPTGGQTDMLDLIVDLGQALDENNVPESGRWIVLPMWAIAMLKKGELREADKMGDASSVLRNGMVGTIDRFTVYSSNQLPAGTADGLATGEFAIFAGHSQAVSFASQINKVETMRSERTFGTIVRGLYVYGCEVLHPRLLAQAIIKRA
jgi:hypothetical protein